MVLTLVFWPGLASVMSSLFEREPWGQGHWLAWGAAGREGMSRCLSGTVTSLPGLHFLRSGLAPHYLPKEGLSTQPQVVR